MAFFQKFIVQVDVDEVSIYNRETGQETYFEIGEPTETVIHSKSGKYMFLFHREQITVLKIKKGKVFTRLYPFEQSDKAVDLISSRFISVPLWLEDSRKAKNQIVKLKSEKSLLNGNKIGFYLFSEFKTKENNFKKLFFN